MAVGVKSWSETASSNASADSNINWSEGQLAPTVNNSARALMAAVKALLNTIGGAVTYGGSANAYTITNDSVGAWSAYTAPSLIMLKANHTNSGAATVNVDGLGAKTIKTADGGDVASGDIVSGGLYMLAYDGTYMQVINTIGGGSYQPLDATLTAFAALAGSSGQVARWTGTDTFTLDNTSAAGRTLWNYTDPNADRITFWDDSAGSFDGLTLGTGLSITLTQLDLDADLQSWAGVTRASGFDTFAATPSSANLRALVTDEAGTGSLYFTGGALGTPASGTLTSCTGLPISTGVSGLGTGVATALAVAVGSAGAPVVNGGALGTPSSGTLTSATGLPISTGVSGLGTSVATALGVAVGSAGAFVVNGGALGTPSSGTLTNATGLPVSGITASTVTALGVGSVELGHASDTTLSRQSAGQMLVEGKAAIQHNGAYTSGQVTFSTSAASGGSSGDIWFKYT